MQKYKQSEFELQQFDRKGAGLSLEFMRAAGSIIQHNIEQQQNSVEERSGPAVDVEEAGNEGIALILQFYLFRHNNFNER